MRHGFLDREIRDESVAWKQIQALREIFDYQLFDSVEINDRTHLRARVNKTLLAIFAELLQIPGFSFDDSDAGHGVGHLVRDYVHAAMLLDEDIPSEELFVGLIGGVLHDIGCSVIRQYDENTRAVRHAEAAALLVNHVSKPMNGIGLSQAERILVSYAVAAHTNYLKPSVVLCADGVERIIEPYVDSLPDGSPLMANHLPRWVDRLDLIGPCFVARHYLTLATEHKDFGDCGFYNVEFFDHMRPLLRETPDGPRTMLEHIKMYADSQTNESVYGKHDFGEMVRLRDEERQQTYRIIEAVRNGHLVSHDEEVVLSAWGAFLKKNIEPSISGGIATDVLLQMHRALPGDARVAWLNGYYVIMKEYVVWAKERMDYLSNLPEEWFVIPGISGDIRSIIEPHPDWKNCIK